MEMCHLQPLHWWEVEEESFVSTVAIGNRKQRRSRGS